MPVVDAYGERKYQQIMEETWGHLRAKPGENFAVSFVFAHDLCGMTCLLDFEWPEGLEGSPWLDEDTEDLMNRVVDRAKEPRGGIWRFVGRYIVDKKGWRKFKGKTTRLNLKKMILMSL